MTMAPPQKTRVEQLEIECSPVDRFETDERLALILPLYYTKPVRKPTSGSYRLTTIYLMVSALMLLCTLVLVVGLRNGLNKPASHGTRVGLTAAALVPTFLNLIVVYPATLAVPIRHYKLSSMARHSDAWFLGLVAYGCYLAATIAVLVLDMWSKWAPGSVCLCLIVYLAAHCAVMAKNITVSDAPLRGIFGYTWFWRRVRRQWPDRWDRVSASFQQKPPDSSYFTVGDSHEDYEFEDLQAEPASQSSSTTTPAIKEECQLEQEEVAGAAVEEAAVVEAAAKSPPSTPDIEEVVQEPPQPPRRKKRVFSY